MPRIRAGIKFMKRCPECGREYDSSMMFCLDDGAELLYGPAASDEPVTAILHETAAPVEAKTRAQIHTTGQTAVAPAGNASRGFDKRLLAAPLLLGLIVLAGSYGYRYLNSSGTSEINSIAVLPFANASGDKETEFLSDGISETLINNFTKIPDLKVTARSTAFRFRGREGEPIVIGRELGVDSVLTGKLLQRGDSLSVQVDLINTSDGAQIWGNRYEGKTSDLVSIQQKIATDVSSQLKLKLTGAQAQQIAKTYTQNPEAYQRYLRGRYHWNRRTENDLKKAIEEFQAATAADASYAMAYVGLADSYLLLPEYAGAKFEDSIPKGRALAEKALQIDPSLGEPHATLGLINHYSWRWEDADREFQNAIELNPNYPTVHHWYSNNLRETGKYAEALAEIKRAHELDPLSGIIGINTGILLMLNGDPVASRQQMLRTIELDPTWFNGHFWLGTLELIDGRFDQAIPHLQKSVELNRAIRPVAMLGFALGRAGRKNEALVLLKELEARYSNGISCASSIAAIYNGLGETEKAVDWLEQSYKDKDNDLPRLRWYPPFVSLRTDPRVKDILRRINLTE